MKTVHVYVMGKVQGVFFRDFTRREAQKHNLCGWVKNMPDGTVEAVFCGKNEAVEKMVNWLSIGSPHSNVTSVDVRNIENDKVYTDFQIQC